MKPISVTLFCALCAGTKCPVCDAVGNDILMRVKCETFPDGGMACRKCGHAVGEQETFEQMFALFNILPKEFCPKCRHKRVYEKDDELGIARYVCNNPACANNPANAPLLADVLDRLEKRKRNAKGKL